MVEHDRKDAVEATIKVDNGPRGWLGGQRPRRQLNGLSLNLADAFSLNSHFC